METIEIFLTSFDSTNRSFIIFIVIPPNDLFFKYIWACLLSFLLVSQHDTHSSEISYHFQSHPLSPSQLALILWIILRWLICNLIRFGEKYGYLLCDRILSQALFNQKIIEQVIKDIIKHIFEHSKSNSCLVILFVVLVLNIKKYIFDGPVSKAFL